MFKDAQETLETGKVGGREEEEQTEREREREIYWDWLTFDEVPELCYERIYKEANLTFIKI